jgi:hypothetical protein
MSNQLAIELLGGLYTAFVNQLSLVIVKNNEISNEVLIDIQAMSYPFINPVMTFKELTMILKFIDDTLFNEEHFKDRIELAFNDYLKGGK